MQRNVYLLREDLKAFQFDYNLLREDLQKIHLSSVSYEKIYFCAKQKASLKSQKKGVKGTPHFVLGAYSSFSILRLALSITSVFKEAR